MRRTARLLFTFVFIALGGGWLLLRNSPPPAMPEGPGSSPAREAKKDSNMPPPPVVISRAALDLPATNPDRLATNPDRLALDSKLVRSQSITLSPAPDALLAALARDRAAILRFAGEKVTNVEIVALAAPAEAATDAVVFGQIVGQVGSLVRLAFKEGSVSGLIQNPERHEATVFESDRTGRGNMRMYALHDGQRCGVCDQNAQVALGAQPIK